MIKLLSALKKLPAENCFILTYNLDLPFFESALFESLYGAGCRNTVVLCDPQQYQLSLDSDTELLRYAGQRYLLYGGLTSPRGAFHPKLILQTNKTSGQLFITSANLTQSGYSQNFEVVTSFSYDTRKPDLISWGAFDWAFNYLNKLIGSSDHAKIMQKRLNRLKGTTPWLRETPPSQENERIWFLHNLDNPILDQINGRYKERDGSRVKKVSVVSPYFDSSAQALKEFLHQLNPEEISVFTQTAQGLQQESITRFLQDESTPIKFYNLSNIKQRLHAKTITFETENGVWTASGSANFSAPALLKTSSQGNTEIMVLRFEPDPSYFDKWMEEVTSVSFPFDFDSLLLPTEPQVFNTLAAEIKLQNVTLMKSKLELAVDPKPTLSNVLRLVINNDAALVMDFSQWEITPDGNVAVNCAKAFVSQTDMPMLISVHYLQNNGSTLQSNPMLLHNLSSLEKFSVPQKKTNRPPVPEGLIPADAEQCAQILEMIQGLLITNQEQLAKHNQRIVADRNRELEEVEIPEEYNPDEHVVPEPVRRPVTNLSNSSDLYIDYDEHLTYQEILNAVLAISYNKINEVTTKTPQETGSSGTDVIDEKRDEVNKENKEPINLSEQILLRISSGFKRLVGNFVKGLSDEVYMQSIPPTYLLELWSIITVYLRVVRNNKLLSDEDYTELSLTMLFSFWGRYLEPGAWSIVETRLSKEEKGTELNRLSIPINIWLQVYGLQQILNAQKDHQRFDLSAWMRRFTKLVFPIKDLLAYTKEDYQAVWKLSFESNVECQPAEEVVQELLRISQDYSESSLKEEIESLTGKPPIFSYENRAEETHVPCMQLEMPLSDEKLELIWRVFHLFSTQPMRKTLPWARFENTNPKIEPNDICKVTVFYREDCQTLLFSVIRLSGNSFPDYFLTDITPIKFAEMSEFNLVLSESKSKGQ